MQLFTLHRKSIYTVYQNQLCSFSTLIITLVVLLSLILPFYVISFVNSGALWDRYRLVYEQPEVHFNYRYLFLAEVDRNEAASTSRHLITCSSFDSYNELTAQWQDCGAIKVKTVDGNMDGKIDKLSASVAFNVPDGSMGLVLYTFYFFLDVQVKNNCLFSIPALISLGKQIAPVQPFASGTITHRGHLRASQTTALQCPYWMRNIKSHFSHNYYPGENFTSFEKFQPESILQQIESSNAAYFDFDQQRSRWIRDGSADIEINVELLIGGEDCQRTALLYHASLWQKIAQVWNQYFSVLLVILWIADKLKDWLFESFTIRALELVPWKEKGI